MRITAASHLLALALVGVAIAGSCSSSAPLQPRRAPDPQRTSVVLRDWPVGLRPTHPVEEEDEEELEAPAGDDVEPAAAGLEDGGVAGGDGGASGDGGPPVAGVPSCDEMASHVIAWMIGEIGGAGVEDAEIRAVMENLIRLMGEQIKMRCHDDDWSAEARRCFADASTQDELESCKRYLTPEQDQRMKDAMIGVKP